VIIAYAHSAARRQTKNENETSADKNTHTTQNKGLMNCMKTRFARVLQGCETTLKYLPGGLRSRTAVFSDYV